MKAGVFACAFAWLSSTVKCEYIVEAERSFDVRRRHHERRGTFVLIPKHMDPMGRGYIAGAITAGVVADHGYSYGGPGAR